MINVYIENEQDKFDITDETEDCIRRVAAAVFEYEKCDFDAEVDVTVTDNENIRELNRTYRDKDSATDVLSFPILEFDESGNIVNSEFDEDTDSGCILLGDIVISAERAEEQAEEYGHGIMREIGFLTAHSMLHLLGYDHETGEDEIIMRSKEREILNSLGLTR
ncbi:MAG: rRNA maturation RNase YbeY [Oscillospiraceae bacterium]|nr:rRNA maturation RNase YbeY [Oscillospiraceae bacterium]